MLQKWNRFLSFLLAITLVTTTFGSDFATARVYAVEGTEMTQPSEDGGMADLSIAEEVTTSTEETVSEVTEVTETTETTEEVVEEPATTEEPQEEITEEETTEEEEVSEEEITDETEVKEPEEKETVVEEKLVKITYQASKGGTVSTSSEEVDINKEDAAFQGSTATPWNDKYTFVDWTDKDGNQVSTEATFVPSDVTEDATFTANFLAAEDIETAMPKISAEGVKAGDMIVSVSADAGLFPEGTEIVISAVDDGTAVELAEKSLGEGNVKKAKAVDITFKKDGVELQPADAKYVHVSIALDEAIESNDAVMLHEHDGEVNEIADATVTDTGAEFDANKFSIFIVAEEGESTHEEDEKAVLTYNFYINKTDTEAYNTQYVKQGETLADPGIPTLEKDQEFFGWFYTEGDQEVKVTFGEVGKVESQKTINAYAKIKTTYYVTFIGSAGEVVQVLKRTTTDTTKPVEITKAEMPHYESAKDTQTLKGWSKDKDTRTEEEKQSGADDRAVVDKIDARTDKMLYAVVVDAFWITFDENDDAYQGETKISSGGASYTAPIHVEKGKAPSTIQAEAPVPTRPGYTFEGWYTGQVKTEDDSAGMVTGDELNWNAPLTQDTTVYAKWEANQDTTYTVILWQQKITDSKDTKDNKSKTYDFKASYTLNAATGTELNENSISSYKSQHDEGFHYQWFEVVYLKNGDKTTTDSVRAKGDTVVNVYFDRDLMTINFNKYTKTNDTNGTLYGVDDGVYFELRKESSWNGTRWYHGNERYRGDRYKKSVERTYTGLYGQSLAFNGYTWPTGTYTISNDEGSVFTLEFIDVFKFTTYYVSGTVLEVNSSSDSGDPYYMYFYQQQLDGTYKLVNTHTHYISYYSTGSSYYCDDYYTGFEPYQYVKNYDAPKTLKLSEKIDVDSYDELYLYFNRVSNAIQFKDNFNGTTSDVTDVDERFAAIPFEQKLNSYEELAPKLANRPGYTFKGWYEDQNGQTKFDWDSEMPAANKVLYAHYEKDRYHVSLKADGGVLPEGQIAEFDLDYGDKIEKESIYRTTKEGYELVGWFDDKTGFAYDFAEITEDVNLTAKWRNPGTVNIVYDAADHGSNPFVDEYNYATNSAVVVAAPPATIEDGYTFIGWMINGDSNNTMYYPNNSFEITSDIIKDKKVTLTAKYQKTGDPGSSTETTTITYNANGGVGNDKVVGIDPKLLKNEGVKALTLAEAGFTRANYKFLGWSKTSDGQVWLSAEELAQGVTIAADNLPDADGDGNPDVPNTLYAIWEKMVGSYTIEYYKGDITNNTDKDHFIFKTKSKTVDVGTEISLTLAELNYKKPTTGYQDGVQQGKVPYVIEERDDNVIYVLYKPVKVTVTITGNTATKKYTGSEQSVAGYTVSISGDGYTENDFAFVGAEGVATVTEDGKTKPAAKGTNVGPYVMGLTKKCFENRNSDFTDVTFVIASDGQLTIDPIDVTVTITGKTETAAYDGKEHKQVGYDVEISNTIYKESDFTFTPAETMTLEGGKPVAARTDAGKTMMGLAKGQFANTNNNFRTVTFNVTDGYVEITKIDVTVTITGHFDSRTYDGQEHTVTGYDVQISNSLYKESDFTFSGTAEAKRKDAGKTEMGLGAGQFKNNNDNFNKVTFTIAKDGYQEIIPVKEVKVTIVGKNNTADYDGQEHTVTGYDITISDKLYKESDFTFDYDGDGQADRLADKAVAKRTDAGETKMGLSNTQFKNNNNNFKKVVFEVTDGYQKINPVSVIVTITGHTGSYDYDGKEKNVSGYDVSFSNALYTEDDFQFTGTTKEVKRTDAGKTDMGLKKELFVNKNDNFNDVEFAVTDGYVEIKKINATVTIVGNSNTSAYDGEKHSVSGYTATASSDLYKVDGETKDFTFSGTASAERTDAGKTDMGLAASQFKNTNTNFETVTFEVTDGYQEITPIDITVTIVGNNSSVDYDGSEHVVTGYKVTEISNTLYKEADITFSGTAESKRTDAGKTMMGLTPEMFGNSNKNFGKVTFNVTDGYQEIKKINVTVTITGNTLSVSYDNEEHSVTGYTAKANSTLYDVEKDFTFSGEASAEGTDANKYPMGLVASQFRNQNENFDKVTFNITDGYLEIKPIDVTVTITGNYNSTVYDGKEHEVTGYTAKASSDLYDVTKDFSFSGTAAAKRTDVGKTNMNLVASQFTNANTNFGKVTFNVTDGYQEITAVDEVVVTITGHNNTTDYDGESHTVAGYDVKISNNLYKESDFTFSGSASATRKDAGRADMGLKAEQFKNNNTNFATVTFNVIDGYQAITPINVTVTIVGNSVTTDYDGQEHVARGYKVTGISNNLFKESDVQFHAENYENGAVAKRTNAGTTYIGLTKNDFYTSNSNFGEVTFNVTDGFVTISPIDVTVTIVGNNNTTDYDGTSHTVSGYTATANSTLYDVEKDFTFSGTASATQKDAGTKNMGLASEQFVNQNNNFKKVTFEVTDGYQTINPIDVTVTIVGNNNTTDYDGTSHTVTGYKATANSTLYDVENDFTFSGTAEAARTDAGTTKMNLAPEQFVNQNNNFKKVTFEVTDGYQTINPIDVTVTIVGANNTTNYDGEEHTVTGYKATANTALYDVENDFTFSGTASATQKDAGTKNMGLASDQFVNQNNNFKKVTFEVTDGYQTINPIDVTVTIVGANNTATYNGEDHTVTGYTATASSTLYDVDKDFIFRPAQNVVVNEKGKPTATRKNEGTTNMNLAAEQFENNNNNFKTVTFNVTDGYQTITAVNEVVVTITGHNNTTDYDGKDHTVTGYDVAINNPLYTTADFTFSGTASATQKDAGTKNMGLAAEQFANKNSNFAKVTFNVTDGYQTVNPIEVTVTITGNNDTKDYDGQDHTVTDYSVQISNPLYTEADFEFTGTASATQKDAGTKKMGLASEQFKNKNTNFKAVTFNVTDGYMTINPIDVTVTVVGNKVETAYDGQEHTAEGYNVTNISTDLYTTSDFEFTGKDKVSRTDAGKSEMGLTAEQFANKNTNFKTVTFNVTDGYVDISKIDVTVKIVGNTVTEDYDGTEHVAESYEVKEISSELYTKNDFAFSGEAKAARTNAGQTDMGLTASMFTNNNQNFGTVTFDITDGYVKINKINATVTITGHNDTKDYAGTEYGVQGYDVTKISTNLYTANDFSFTGEATASREDAGTTYMGLSEDDFTNNNENFETVTFDVTDGYITINPIAVKVEIVGNNSTVDFDGAEHVVSGFTATASSDLYDTSADMTFTPASDMDLENGQPAARRINYGTTNMNLAGSMFANTNDNFTNVVFEVTDGYQTIGAIDAEVTIKGTIVTEVYNGKVHTAKGYTAEANTDLYDVDEFIDFNGAALAEITNAGTEYMGLTSDMFSNNNENFSNVRFVVTDGYITVEPAKVVVKVTGNNDTVDYDGKVHTVTGYKVKFEDAPDAAAGNIIVDLVSTTGKDIYKEEFIRFTGTDKVEESKTGKHMMNLAAEQFANTNDNFDVTFEVEDGYLEINPVSFDIIASTLDDSKIYSGKTWTGADFDYILTGNKSENKNPLGRVIDAATDFVKDLISPLMVVAADEVNPHAVTIGDTEYTVSGLNVDVNAKDVKADGYLLDIVGTPVITDPQGNDVTDMFNLTYDKGTLMITPAPVTVTANSYSRNTAQSDPTFTAVVKAEDENLQTEAERSIKYTISRAAGNGVGRYAITATPDNAEALDDGTYLQGNFKVTYVPGTLTITAVPSGGGDTPSGGGTPSDPTPIPDEPTPTAAAPAGVLGARREDALTDGAAVLGARRGRTEDEANTNARVFAIVMAVAAAITTLIAGKKKEEEED